MFWFFISTGSPINPISRKNWEGSGVIPDVPVPAGEALRQAQLLALTAVIKRTGQEQSHAAQWALSALQADGTMVAAVEAEDFEGNYGAMSIRMDDEHLLLIQGRRPVRTLVLLVQDLFAIREDPSVRVAFLRDASGRVSAFEQRTVDGSLRRFQRALP